ncbi:MAG: anti-sigma factor antagonist [Leptospiraceae bacterium]|nr:MAG: anti-sigma factor antagonist [Leptospiraceae bacterium]
MSNSDLTISQDIKNNICILTIEGKLDAKTAPELTSVLSSLLTKYSKIICNLEKLNYIASAGIGVFLKFLQEAKAKNGDLVLVGLQKQVRDVFDLLKFTSLFKIYSNNEEAIKHLT